MDSLEGAEIEYLKLPQVLLDGGKADDGGGWWKRMVEADGGGGWWSRMVESDGGGGWWRQMVEAGFWSRMCIVLLCAQLLLSAHS